MSNSCELSICFHHGGRIIYVGCGKEYSGGELKSKHGLDIDRFGFFDLVEEVENLGYTSWDNLYFKDPETGEFKELNDDREVMKMISFMVNGDKFVNIYVDNGNRTSKETDIHNDHGEVTKEAIEVGGIYSGLSLRENFAADDDDEGSISEDNDYIPAESSDTEDGLDDDELVSDDEEYIEARQNMKNFKVVIDDRKGNKCNEIVHIDTHGADGEIMSEYEESDGNINSESSEDEDGDVRRFKLQKVTYDPKCDHKSLKIVLGMRFQDGFQCKRALRTNAIENGNPIRFIRCNARQCEARCIPECNWRCYGSMVKSDGHFVIKTVGGLHTCPRVMNNKLATANWVATELLEIFRTKPDIKIKELAAHIMNRYGCDVSVPKLYRARLKAQENLRGEKFEVCLQDDQFVVNVPNRTCTCRLWDLTGIPCIHACRALHFLKVDAANFVDDCYSVQRYLDTYRYGIEPLDGPEMWLIAQGDTIEPPLVRKLPGRPPKKRKRGLEEKEIGNSSKLRSFGLQMTCRRCQQSGHNKRTCKNPPVELPQPANVNTGLGVATFEGTGHIYMKMSCDTQVHHVNSKRGGI
ncbi:hypothetical protein C2S52_010899 [Perilla frutescens var. hirtella]|nr:hypothetical protein C2S52_010899 [Perilla frutescens var. hirtella]